MNREMLRHLIVWLSIIAALFFAFNAIQGERESESQELNYSEFVAAVSSGQVSDVVFAGDGVGIRGVRTDGSRFYTVRPVYVEDGQLIPHLLDNSVRINAEEPEEQSLWLRLLIASFPLLLIIGLGLLFMRYSQGGGKGGNWRNNPLNFGKSKAKMLQGGKVKTTFADVAGCDEAKEEVSELIEFLRDPERFNHLGGRIPRGVLMIGSPGTGKTLLAKAVAGEAEVPFFSISGSDFVEMFVGVGASRVRDMFEQARQNAPCIVFIDEIDAVGRHRGAGLGGGHDEREQTLNQLLVEMDGFEDQEGVIVIAATNRPDVLDPALLRPGRFDRQVTVALPDIKGREAILQVHLRKIQQEPDLDVMALARGTPGFSGADLENLINEAALMAARAKAKKVNQHWLEAAKDRVMLGAERRSMVMTEKDKKLTAYHEAGHAIVGLLCEEHDPVYKVSIIPRGRALGVTMFLPEQDKFNYTRRQLLSNISSLYGGRLAEKLIYGDDCITTGAANDIKRATELARNMVTRWGLSSMQPLEYERDNENVFLGRTAAQGSQPWVSADTAAKVDAEVEKIAASCYDHAENILKDNLDKLHLMADVLMEHETIDAGQIKDIMAGVRPAAPEPAPPPEPEPETEEVEKDQTASAKGGSGRSVDTDPTQGAVAS